MFKDELQPVMAKSVGKEDIEVTCGRRESFSVKFPHGESEPGPVTFKLLEMLREVVAGQRTNDKIQDWLCDVHSTPEDFRKGGI
ncbi:hypothetical protein QTG54_004312 [Skeletonema marinoi]|uniref:Uncharacterized protein n=1 Tax=Skeletonema marinoi TaxID=267567 RepID=A0AAD8YH13_9STRA|nr:hypothetical protein QTG54_004312 [Skeletonema marinoi]